jgi:hypothetical protein
MAHPKGEYPTQAERERAKAVFVRLGGEVRLDDKRITDEEAVLILMCMFNVPRSVAADDLSILRGHGGDIRIYTESGRER